MPAYSAAQGGPSRVDLERLYGDAYRFRFIKNLPQAMKALAELETLVRQTVAASPGPAAAAGGKAAPAQAGPKRQAPTATGPAQPAKRKPPPQTMQPRRMRRPAGVRSRGAWMMCVETIKHSHRRR